MKFTKLIIVAISLMSVSAFAAEDKSEKKSSEGQSSSVACQAASNKTQTEVQAVAASAQKPADKATAGQGN